MLKFKNTVQKKHVKKCMWLFEISINHLNDKSVR